MGLKSVYGCSWQPISALQSYMQLDTGGCTLP